MSSVNTKQDCQASGTPAASMSSEPAKSKFTATQIEKECPARLQQIAREIAERLKRAEKQANLAADHVIAVDKLLAEAKGLCDRAGFDKFREFFCPQLGRSQAYALLAIGAGKKTLAEHRAAERERKQKSRAHQRVATPNSGTVPETSKPQDAPTKALAVQPTSTATGQTPERAKPHSAVAPGDEAIRAFTGLVMELNQRTGKHPARRFSATAVPIEVLAQLGNLLTEIANIKKSETVEAALITGNDATPVVQAAVSTVQAGLQATIDMVA